jgi:hypothetical protein
MSGSAFTRNNSAKRINAIAKLEDELGFKLEFRNNVGTLSYFLNGKFVAILLDDLVGEVFPAFSLASKNDQVTLSFK